jgi:DNA-binding NarL/FixJ family response regulator
MNKAGKQQAVLIVEDHDAMRALMREFVVGACPDCRILDARDGAQARMLVSQCRPKVVLMDIGLPDANGLVLAGEIKALHPETKVIVVTQHGEGHYREHADAAGAFAYVTKDRISTELLPHLVRALREDART